LKNYHNFLFEYKNNLISPWFYYDDIKKIFNDNFLKNLESIQCENNNAHCVIISDLDSSNNFLKIFNDIRTIDKKAPKKHIIKLSNYHIIDIQENDFIEPFDNDTNFKLAILKNTCKKSSPRQKHGFTFEEELCKKFNMYDNSCFSLNKKGAKWDAYGRIPNDVIDFFSKTKNLSNQEKDNFSANFNWNIKTVKSGATISMGDFLRISGLEKVPNYDKLLKDIANENENMKDIELIQTHDDPDTQFMFCCKSYTNINYTIYFMIIEYDDWDKYIEKENIKETINNIYKELHKHRLNAKTIVDKFFGKTNNNINQLTGEYVDKNNKKVEVNINKTTKKYKSKINDVLDKILKTKTWTITFEDNEKYTSSEYRNYNNWRNEVDAKWHKFTSDKTKQYNEDNKLKIDLAFKRDSKGQLRLQASMSNSLFEQMKQLMIEKSHLLSINNENDNLEYDIEKDCKKVKCIKNNSIN